MRDFFISYTSKDLQWAEWIAWSLEEEKYTHYFQAWDFRPGGNFVLEMQKATVETKQTLLVLSNNYLQALYTQPEWAAAFVHDPTGNQRRMIPVRIDNSKPPGLLAATIYVDLHGLGPDDAKARLIAALKPSGRPDTKPAFPGAAPTPPPAAPSTAFPGPNTSTPPAGTADPTRAAAEELDSIFGTSRETFFAQARLRDELEARVRKRLNVWERYQYEEFFDRYFDKLTPEELRLHRTMRGFTENILHDYNQRALRILDQHPALAKALPSSEKLRRHLLLWLSKFESTFKHTPSMALLYVGVEERAKFPREIEGELRAFLARN